MNDSEQLPMSNGSREAYYLETVGLNAKQLRRLGGPERLDRMNELSRKVLINDARRFTALLRARAGEAS